MRMMIKHFHLYIFLSSLFANCMGDFNLSFEDVVAIESKDYIKCKFEIQFDDEIVKKADVVCDPFKKKSQNQKLIYEFESKTFHKITLIGIVRRDGKASITSKQITKVGTCCHRKIVRGTEYQRVKYDLEIPKNCRDNCIYTKKSNNTLTESKKYFCFTKMNKLVSILTCDDLHQSQSFSEDLKQSRRKTKALKQQLVTSPAPSCPSYEDLQKDSSTKGQCAYWWGNLDEMGPNPSLTPWIDVGKIFGIHTCSGEVQMVGNNTQWSVNPTLTESQCSRTSFGDFEWSVFRCNAADQPYIRNLIVTPGCYLILYGQPQFNYLDIAQQSIYDQVADINWLYVVEGPNTLYELRSQPQSLVCSCNPRSKPRDAWEVIVECDNRQGAANTTCNYIKTVGTSYGYKNGTGGSNSNSSDYSSTLGGSATASVTSTASASAGIPGLSAKASVSVSASISASFSKTLRTSKTTKVDWSTVASNSYEETTQISISETIPPGKCVRVEQVVGYHGQAIVRSNVYRMTQSCTST